MSLTVVGKTLTVMGIDPSTKTGIVIVRNWGDKLKVVYQHEFTYPKDRGMERVQLIGQAVRDRIEEWMPDVVVIEGYGFANKHTLVTLVEIGTAIRLVLHEKKRGRWGNVAPNTLKKFATGEGQSKKDKVMLGVFKTWGFEGTDNECDAFALAAIGLYAGCKGLTPKVKPKQREAWQDWGIENRRVFD